MSYISILAALVGCGQVSIPSEPGPSAEVPIAAEPTHEPSQKGDPRAQLRAQPLKTTRHGVCRMDCRHIDESEVNGVLAKGEWDPSRTRLDGECPTHALEGRGSDGHMLRLVFAACSNETRLVTAIDLDQDWPCSCG